MNTRLTPLFAALLIITFQALGQEEGPAVARARFDRPNSLSVSGGLSRVFNKNVGDYTSGTNFEFSYLHRLNKLISIGGFVSFYAFNYDPAKTPTSPAGKDLYKGLDLDVRINSTGSTTYKQLYSIASNYEFLQGFQLSLEGGKVSITTIGMNIKANLIPVSDKMPVSVYVLTRPFVAAAKRADVSGSGKMYLYEATVVNGVFTTTTDGKWYPTQYKEEWGPDGYPSLKGVTTLTGGLQVGPGIEINPTGKLSFQVQALLGYTLPVSFVSTQSYPMTLGSYTNSKFPTVRKGFPAMNVQAGLSYNF
ncbi:MAG: hypothetical protein ACKOAR_09445 [Bacteroidota bacterium]